MSPTVLTLNELHDVARAGLLAGDWTLPLLANPWCWVAVLLAAVLPGYSSGARRWLMLGSTTLSLEVVVLAVLLLLPVSGGWAALNGALAIKAERHLNWAAADPKTLSRFQALKLNLALQDEAIVTDKLVGKLVAAGAPRQATENVIMSAMAAAHRQNPRQR
jgi:hypothetical protein